MSGPPYHVMMEYDCDHCGVHWQGEARVGHDLLLKYAQRTRTKLQLLCLDCMGEEIERLELERLN